MFKKSAVNWMLRPHSPIGLQRGKNPTQNMNLMYHIFPPVFQEKFLFSSLFWYKVVKCSFVRKFYLKNQFGLMGRPDCKFGKTNTRGVYKFSKQIWLRRVKIPGWKVVFSLTLINSEWGKIRREYSKLTS